MVVREVEFSSSVEYSEYLGFLSGSCAHMRAPHWWFSFHKNHGMVRGTTLKETEVISAVATGILIERRISRTGWKIERKAG
jgi:hypothetical protein